MSGTSKAMERAADVAALIRSRNPLLWIISREEARVEAALFEAEALAGRTVDRAALSQSHSHDGGRTWHDGH